MEFKIITNKEVKVVSQEKATIDALTEELSNLLLGEKFPLDIVNANTKIVIVPANRKITKNLLRQVAKHRKIIEIDPSPVRSKIREILMKYE